MPHRKRRLRWSSPARVVRTLEYVGVLSRDRLALVEQGLPLSDWELGRITRALGHPQLAHAEREWWRGWIQRVSDRRAVVTTRGLHPDVGDVLWERPEYRQERSMGNPMPDVAA